MNKLVMIAEMGKGVFTAQDLAVLWEYPDEAKLYELIKYYVRRGDIFALARGLYSSKQYTERELRNDPELLYMIASKLVPNSYISLFTVLREHGVMDQYYDKIYSVARRSVVREVMGVEFVYKQIKEEVLLSDQGIEKVGDVRVASIERAMADTWYLYPKFNIERLGRVNRGELRKIVKLYDKRVMINKYEEIGKE